MPNLTQNKRMSLSSALSFAPPMNSLHSKNYHTSDSRLSKPKELSPFTMSRPRGSTSQIRPSVVSDYSGRELQLGQNSRMNVGGSHVRDI
jgi:hypothetical protein